MALTKNPVTGMKDILPQEMILRDYVIGLIKSTYESFGYTPIETPVVESLGNLLSKQGKADLQNSETRRETEDR